MPSKTWMRERLPSITRKCTRTVSPALNRGTSRSWRCSMDSMTLLIWDCRSNGRRMLADGDPARRPVRRHDDRADPRARHGAEVARVAGRAPVVAEQEVRAPRHARPRERPRVALVVGHVPLVEAPAVDEDEAPAADEPLLHPVSGAGDDALQERRASRLAA